MSTCTWSLCKSPSNILPSFCCANSCNVSPKCGRKFLNINFFLYFGIQITWYLHSHFVWFKLWTVSIGSLADLNFERFSL